MKILIADDHWVVRESLKMVMKRLQQRFEPLEAANFAEAQVLLRKNPDVDLMLIDLIMPGFNEFEGLKQLRREFPEIPVVVVSVHEDPEFVIRSISHGVVGYVPKSAGGEEITRALERVMAGEVSFPRDILQQRPARLSDEPRPNSPQASQPIQDATLSPREREILAHLGRGHSVSKIASDLALSPHTVRVHIANITRKLGLKDRSATIHYAVSQAQAR